MPAKLILPFLILWSLTATGQDWFTSISRDDKVSGYVVGIAGDTIRGYIQYDYPIIMQKRIVFLDNRQGTPTTYTPQDIRGYGLDPTYWASIEVTMDTYDGPYVFKRFGILESEPGPLALYRVFEERDKQKERINSEEAEVLYDRIRLLRQGNSLEHLYIKKQEEPALLLTAKPFRKSFAEEMKHLVGDHKELMQQIRDKELKREDIDLIVATYNDWFLSRLRK